MISWSHYGLPNPTNSLSIELADSSQSTTMENGYVVKRQRFTLGWRTVPMTWEFSDIQFAIFQAVYEHKLSHGTDYFQMSLPLGDGFETYTCRFKSGWQATQYPVLNWRVSAQVELSGGSAMTEEALDILIAPEE